MNSNNVYLLKTLLLTFMIWVLPIQNSDAQNSSQVSMQVTVTAQEGVRFIVEKMQFQINVENLEESLTISPDDSEAAYYSIHSTPGRNVSITFNEPLSLFHSSGNSIELSDLKLLVGDNYDPEKMNSITPERCSSLTIPENGELHFRIGGKLSGNIDEYGVYTGTLRIDSQCLN